jgi:hypothetical protein
MQIYNYLTQSLRLLASALIVGGAVATTSSAAEVAAQKNFASAEEAVSTVVADLKSNNVGDLAAIFGPRVERLLTSGDEVADRNARERFIATYEESHHLDQKEDNAVLVIGKEDWPFPIPLRKIGDRWQFDTAAGEQELINRRIGRNELATIQTMLAYVDAQLDYAELIQQRTGTAEYAQFIVSHPGKEDGLYWPVAEGEAPSPLGPLFAEARLVGYRKSGTAEGRVPYNGYFFKILTAQGSDAPGGAVDYIIRGKMIGGFGLVAWPAQYGDSGVMSFIVDHQAIVYQKNLGPQSGAIAEAMTRYDPDASWQKVEAASP